MSLLHIFLVILVLALLIAFHEFGHFICAKSLGVPVKIFSIGFPMGTRPLLSYKWGETDIQLNPLPLGGFCAFMDDENRDEEEADEVYEPGDKRFLKNRAIWERAIIISGGVVANTIVAYFIFLGLAFSFGIPNAVQGVFVSNIIADGPASAVGFQANDQILKVGEQTITGPDIMIAEISKYPGRSVPILIKRNQEEMVLSPTPNAEGKIGVGIAPLVEAEIFVKEVAEQSAAAQAGFQEGDQLVEANGQALKNALDLAQIAQGANNQTLSVTVLRAGEKQVLQTRVDAKGQPELVLKYYRTFRPLTGIGEGFSHSWTQMIDTFVMLLDALWKLVSGALPLSQVGGLVEVVNIGTQISQDSFVMLLQFAALISIELAILNILPIPALDGGHLFLLMIEGLRGKPLPRRMEENLHYAGFVILLGLGVFLIFKDVWGLTLGKG